MTDSSNMRRHLMIHTGEKPFKAIQKQLYRHPWAKPGWETNSIPRWEFFLSLVWPCSTVENDTKNLIVSLRNMKPTQTEKQSAWFCSQMAKELFLNDFRPYLLRKYCQNFSLWRTNWVSKMNTLLHIMIVLSIFHHTGKEFWC